MYQWIAIGVLFLIVSIESVIVNRLMKMVKEFDRNEQQFSKALGGLLKRARHLDRLDVLSGTNWRPPSGS